MKSKIKLGAIFVSPFKFALAHLPVVSGGVPAIVSAFLYARFILSDGNFRYEDLIGLFAAAALGGMFGILIIYQFFWWLLRLFRKSNGGPIESGNIVRILVGKHKGQLAQVYDTWPSRGQLLLDLGPEEKRTFKDIFFQYQIERVGKAKTNEEITCRGCGAKFRYNTAIHDDSKKQIRELLVKSRLLVADYLKKSLGYDLTDAKAISFHLASPDGKCHRCGEPLPMGAITECPRCQSTNIRMIVFSDYVKPSEKQASSAGSKEALKKIAREAEVAIINIIREDDPLPGSPIDEHQAAVQQVISLLVHRKSIEDLSKAICELMAYCNVSESWARKAAEKIYAWWDNCGFDENIGSSKKRVLVEVNWLRDPPMTKSYSSVAHFEEDGDNWKNGAWSIVLSLPSPPSEDQRKVMAEANFLVEDAPHERLSPGRTFAIFEGNTQVASVKVLGTRLGQG